MLSDKLILMLLLAATVAALPSKLIFNSLLHVDFKYPKSLREETEIQTSSLIVYRDSAY